MSLKDLHFYNEDKCPVCEESQKEHGVFLKNIDCPNGTPVRTHVIKCENCDSQYSIVTEVTKVYINYKGKKK